jgi:hypothetical protein
MRLSESTCCKDALSSASDRTERHMHRRTGGWYPGERFECLVCTRVWERTSHVYIATEHVEGLDLRWECVDEPELDCPDAFPIVRRRGDEPYTPTQGVRITSFLQLDMAEIRQWMTERAPGATVVRVLHYADDSALVEYRMPTSSESV